MGRAGAVLGGLGSLGLPGVEYILRGVQSVHGVKGYETISLKTRHRPGPAWGGLGRPGPDWGGMGRPGAAWGIMDFFLQIIRHIFEGCTKCTRV